MKKIKKILSFIVIVGYSVSQAMDTSVDTIPDIEAPEGMSPINFATLPLSLSPKPLAPKHFTPGILKKIDEDDYSTSNTESSDDEQPTSRYKKIPSRFSSQSSLRVTPKITTPSPVRFTPDEIKMFAFLNKSCSKPRDQSTITTKKHKATESSESSDEEMDSKAKRTKKNALINLSNIKENLPE